MKTILKKYIKKLINEYYDATEKKYSIEDIIKMWVNDSYGKAYDENVHNFYSAAELWPYREYSWNKDKSRRGVVEYEELIQAIKKYGWKKENPLILLIGKNGIAKVGEGNHRLAIARDLGLKRIPVRFEFRDRIVIEQIEH